jgi:predicted alpha/beta superfamily hydrolase
MKIRTPVILLAVSSLLAVAAFAADAPAPVLPAHTIPNSQVRVLPRNAAGRQYQLHIGLPESYATHPERRYPIVFVTDGYWDFAKISVAEGSLTYDKVVPEFITVGIGYAGENLNYNKLRLWELPPVPHGDNGENTGHGADFLRTIETEIIPLMEREYRVDASFRVLAGSSLGGLFTLYTMYTKPELFQGYIAATPAVVVGNDWLLGYEEAFFRSGRPLHARLFVSGGGNESPGFLGGILRYNARVCSRKNPDLAYKFLVVEGERHGGVQIETYVRGLRFVFEPRAPESGPATSP